MIHHEMPADSGNKVASIEASGLPRFGWMAAFIITLILAAWSNTFFSPFVFDDDHFVIGNPSVTFQRPISLHAPRALTLITYGINYAIGQDSTFGYHVANLGIHCLNVVLVFALLSRYLQNSFTVFLACGIFALHPLQTEAVTYISGRSELLMTTFGLLALLAARKRRYLLTTLCCLLAIMSKEIGVVVIPLVLAQLYVCDLFSHLSDRKLLIGIAAFILLAIFLASHAGLVDSGRPIIERDITQNAQFWQYVAMAVVPVGFSIDHDPESIPVLLQIIALCMSLALAVALTRWLNGITVWVWWVIITVAPRFLMNIPEYLAEHHLYLGMVGISALAAIGITQLLDFAENYAHN